jgi:tetratricopeptide (TPR) repeat protein
MGETENSDAVGAQMGSRRRQSDDELDFEIAFFERILKRLPNSQDVLMALGNNYTERGHFEKGLRIDERLCRLRPADPIIHYNLACSYALVGKVDQAIGTLEQAIALGYHDSGYLQRDPDLDGIRRDPRFQALLGRVQRQQVNA